MAVHADIKSTALKDYDFPLEKVPAYDWDEGRDKIMSCIKKKKPVVIKRSNIAASALKWDLSYLKEHLSQDCKHVVWQSKTNQFRYWNDSVMKQLEGKIEFVPPTRKTEMTLSEFSSRIGNWKRGRERLYLQQPMHTDMGQTIFMDFLQIDWPSLEQVQKQGQWEALTSNLLLIGQEGNVTPVHYDEQENLFCQLVSLKRVLLFPPESVASLYPFPVLHPHDRQSQVDLDQPNYDRFPRTRELRGLDCVLAPGDILYIPNCWWHYVQCLGAVTISLTFWYKVIADYPSRTGLHSTVIGLFFLSDKVSVTAAKVEYPLTGGQKLTIMRNIEKLVGEALKDPREIAPFMQTMVLGRYT